MQDRILLPLLLQLLHGQSLEELPLPLEISLQSADQQTLPEPSRATQEIVASCLDEFIYLGGLVNIAVSVSADLLEILYPYRI